MPFAIQFKQNTSLFYHRCVAWKGHEKYEREWFPGILDYPQTKRHACERPVFSQVQNEKSRYCANCLHLFTKAYMSMLIYVDRCWSILPVSISNEPMLWPGDAGIKDRHRGSEFLVNLQSSENNWKAILKWDQFIMYCTKSIMIIIYINIY